MSRIMDEMCDKAAAEAVHDRNIEIAMKLIQQGKQTVEEIAYLTGLTTNEVNELAQKKSV